MILITVEEGLMKKNIESVHLWELDIFTGLTHVSKCALNTSHDERHSSPCQPPKIYISDADDVTHAEMRGAFIDVASTVLPVDKLTASTFG